MIKRGVDVLFQAKNDKKKITLHCLKKRGYKKKNLREEKASRSLDLKSL